MVFSDDQLYWPPNMRVIPGRRFPGWNATWTHRPYFAFLLLALEARLCSCCRSTRSEWRSALNLRGTGPLTFRTGWTRLASLRNLCGNVEHLKLPDNSNIIKQVFKKIKDFLIFVLVDSHSLINFKTFPKSAAQKIFL